MTMPRRVSRGRGAFRGRAKRPGGTWARAVILPQSIPVSTKVLVATFVLSNSGIGETIRRTLGNCFVVSDQSAASEVQAGSFGMIVANDLAVAAGAASIPGPFTDADDDGWFVWQGWSQQSIIPASGGSFQEGKVYQFDSRAMRRAEEGFAIALMVENASSTNVMQFGINLSLYATRN